MERARLHVDGRWQETERGHVVTSPFTGVPVCEMGLADADHVEAAVAAARRRLADPPPAHARAAVLDGAAARLAADREDLALLLAHEVAKPLRAGRAEVDRTVQTLRFSAAAARTLAGATVPMDAHPAGEGLVAFTRRVPLGVVVGITPFNFPLNLVAHKVAPAVAAGAPIIVKPAEQAPSGALRLVEALVDAGSPPGLVQLLSGTGPDVGAPLATHPDVAVVSFTGSAAVGWRLREAVPRKRVLLELGSAAPLVVERDADLEAAAAAVALHGFSHAGQSCVSIQRVAVHADVVERFLELLVPRVEALVVGDPEDEATEVSAIIDDAAAERAIGQITDAVARGASVLTGGDAEGRLVRPTVVRDVPVRHPLWAEELFAPVVAVRAVSGAQEAIELCNVGAPGLNAGVYTADLALALHYAEALDYGAVLVNAPPTFRVDQMPYGGDPPAGTTREGPAATVAELTTERLVVLRARP